VELVILDTCPIKEVFTSMLYGYLQRIPAEGFGSSKVLDLNPDFASPTKKGGNKKEKTKQNWIPHFPVYRRPKHRGPLALGTFSWAQRTRDTFPVSLTPGSAGERDHFYPYGQTMLSVTYY